MNNLKDPQTNWKYILIVAILAFLVGGGILTYQYLWLPRQEVEMPEIPEKEIEDETANWKTYRNEGYGFELKYPKDWEILHEGYYKTNIPYEVSLAPENLKGLYTAPIAILIHAEDLENASEVEGYEELKLEKEITIHNIKSKEQLRIGPEGEFRAIFVPFKEKLIYELRYNNPEFKETFNQILSTFRFLE